MKNISRKDFIGYSLKGMAILPITGTPVFNRSMELQKIESKDKEVIFRFLQINDTHVQNDRTRYVINDAGKRVGPTYHGANSRMFWLLESLKNENFLPNLDFIMGIGDLVHGGTLDAIKYDFDFFATHFYEQMPIPLYPAVGNHENAQREGDANFEEPYIQLYGKDKVNYSFVHKGIHFIVINNSGTWSVHADQILWVDTRYKLIGIDKGICFELCDLINDPAESENLF